ncbi:extracellular solute-binding protein [Erwinia sp. JUb26]|uniref:extracellular solute-binding protein n=1 Tax=Erwinia sp. JUb26 TaxID=2485126 RepID=UPI000F49D3BF|nr:extracellular solute-binding protein [Erwinia sp. JUb26]ROR11429.1 multiple sugar transport system substrate-binding protein [Erwinia sp. JUb26]
MFSRRFTRNMTSRLAMLMLLGISQASSAAEVSITLASMNDPFSVALSKVAAQAPEAIGVKLNVDIMSYGELMTKTTTDFVGNTGSYDLVTMDIVLAGQYAESGQVVDLTPFVERDKAQLAIPDIYPAVYNAIGKYQDKRVAWPIAGYANVLVYRTDLYSKAGLTAPKTVEELQQQAITLTDRSSGQYGWVANGQKGPASAQDWMQYNAQLGGALLDAQGQPVLDSAANIASLKAYKELFDKAAPPGAVDYDWGGREESFRQGHAATMQTWSVGAAGYSDPQSSAIVGKYAVIAAPSGAGLKPRVGIGGWGLSINADISKEKQEAAWKVIKWLTSEPMQKQLAMLGGGGFIRQSTLSDADLLKKYPFLPVIASSFAQGDGDYRPRIPQYPELESLIGTAVNNVLVGKGDVTEELQKAQKKAVKLF